MASVNFEKIKAGSKPLHAYLMHDDPEERLKHDHANKDLNKDLTYLNRKWYEITYSDCCLKAKSRLIYLDETGNRNKRKDRVEAFSLYIPIPAEVKDKESFFNDIYEICKARFNEDNIVNGYLHCDEVHQYYSDGIFATSLEHIHAVIIPEIDGQLNGKMFSNKHAMQELNYTIEALCRNKYGCHFLTKDVARHKTVEELKMESEKKERLLIACLDKDPVTPKKKGLTSVTLSNEDYRKIIDKANLYDEIAAGTNEDVKKLSIDKKIVIGKYEDAKKAEHEAKKIKKEIENEIASSEEIIKKTDEERINYKFYNSQNKKLKHEIAERERQIEIDDMYIASRDTGVKNKVKSNELETKNKVLMDALKAVNVVVKELDAILEENVGIKYYDPVRKSLRKISAIIDKATSNHIQNERGYCYEIEH